MASAREFVDAQAKDVLECYSVAVVLPCVLLVWSEFVRTLMAHGSEPELVTMRKDYSFLHQIRNCGTIDCLVVVVPKIVVVCVVAVLAEEPAACGCTYFEGTFHPCFVLRLSHD